MHRYVFAVVACVLLAGGIAAVALADAKPDGRGDIGQRTKTELERILNGSSWSWYRGERNGGQTFSFAKGEYRLSDWPPGKGTYKVIDGYTVALTDPWGRKPEMIVSREATHFFLIDVDGGMRWGKRKK